MRPIYTKVRVSRDGIEIGDFWLYEIAVQYDAGTFFDTDKYWILRLTAEKDWLPITSQKEWMPLIGIIGSAREEYYRYDTTVNPFTGFTHREDAELRRMRELKIKSQLRCWNCRIVFKNYNTLGFGKIILLIILLKYGIDAFNENSNKLGIFLILSAILLLLIHWIRPCPCPRCGSSHEVKRWPPKE